MMKAASFLTSLSSDDEDDAMDEKISKEEEREMMIQDPKLCEELDTMRREIASLEEIVRQKRNALEKIRVMIRKKESIYQRDKKKFMNTTGTWVADMNLKKMATKNTVMQKKLSSANRNIRLDTHDKQEMTVKIMSQIDSHHNLAKSMSPFVTRLRDIVNNKQLMNRVEDALGVSQNALTSPSDTNTDSSSASMKAVCERLGHLQAQIMLIMQYFKLVFLLDGKQDPKGGPSEFFLPQYEHMDRETILKQIDSMRETVLSKIERGKTFETNREVVRPLTNAELRQETYETMNTRV